MAHISFHVLTFNKSENGVRVVVVFISIYWQQQLNKVTDD